MENSPGDCLVGIEKVACFYFIKATTCTDPVGIYFAIDMGPLKKESKQAILVPLRL
jgi:hypothetical protein